MVAYFMTECVLHNSTHKNQVLFFLIFIFFVIIKLFFSTGSMFN